VRKAGGNQPSRVWLLARELSRPDSLDDFCGTASDKRSLGVGPDYRAAVSALCRRLKLPKGASLHALRGSHGSHLLASGVPLPAASERLGHSSVRVTADVYAHALRGQDDEAARRWQEFQQDSGAERVLPGVTTRPVTH
jgi:integrase